MPRKGGLSFDGSSLKQKIKKAWDYILPPAILLTIASCVVGGITWFVTTMNHNDSVRVDLHNARSTDVEGARYWLGDSHQVQVYEGNVSYAINFRARTVAIDGPDESDNVRLFDEFNNPEFIQAAKDAGLEISEEILKSHDQREKEWGSGWTEDERYKDLISDAEIFTRYYDADNAASNGPALAPVPGI